MRKQYTRQVLGRSQAKVLEIVRACGTAGINRDGLIAATGLRSGHPSLTYALETLRKRGLILQGTDYRFRAAEAVGAPIDGFIVRPNMLMIYYLGSLKKTGAPIVIKNPESGSEISTSKLTLKNITADISYLNAPAGLQAQGPTTILYLQMEGTAGDDLE